MLLTRRELIASTVAVAASKAIATTATEGAFAFGFFSDTHVGLKLNIAENAQMLAELAKEPIAFCINGGDVTDYGWVQEYQNYRKLLDGFPVKVHHIAGNHDVRWSPLGPKAYRDGTRDPMFQQFEREGVHFLLLDSTVPLSHYGHFEASQLRWLREQLKRIGRQKPIIVATHHWVGRDKEVVDNELELLRVLEPFNVKLILNGHGHSDLLWSWHGLTGTMNRGLYQFSWSRVEVDPMAGQLRLFRRSKEQLTPTLVATVPLGPDRTKRPKWAIPLELGASTLLTPPIGTQYRWDDGPWQPIPEHGFTLPLAAPGTHSLKLRRDNAFWNAGICQLGGGSIQPEWSQPLSGGVMSHLLTDGSRLIVSTMSGTVHCLERENGKPVWETSLGKDLYLHSSPVIIEDLVVVGTSGGEVVALSRATGEVAWRHSTDGPVYASAAFAQGTVVIGSGDGNLYGLDPRSGAFRWKQALPPSQTAFVQSPAATDGTRVFVGAWDKHLYALDAKSGEILWRHNCVGERSFAYSPAIGGPAVQYGKVYVPANGNILWCLDAETGKPVWQTTSPGDKFGYSSPTVWRDMVIVGCLGDKGEARAVSTKDGSIVWTAETGSTIYDSSPCVSDGVAWVGSVSGLVSAVDALEGKILGQYRLPVGHLLGSPVAAVRVAYFGSFNNAVTALRLPG